MERLGTEKIIHAFRVSKRKYPDKDVFAMDGDNAVKRLNRLFALQQQIMRHHPALSPILYGIYKEKSNGWFYGLDEGIEAIVTCEGVTQGDTVGSLLSCIGTIPFGIGLKEVLGEYNLFASFIDDILFAIDYNLAEGSRNGHHLKKNKSAYLLDRCYFTKLDQSRKHYFISRGFLSDIIYVHPDDPPSELYEQAGELYEQADLEDGVKLVGTLIGSYIMPKLDEKLKDLDIEKNHIINFLDPQIRNLMLRWCFTPEISYLQRTISPLFPRIFSKVLCLSLSLLKDKYNRDSLPDEIWHR